LNFFNEDFYPKTTLEIKLDGAPLKSKSIDLATQVEDGDFLNIIRVSNNHLQRKIDDPTFIMNGSLVDIDTIYSKEIKDLSLVEKILGDAHEMEKKWFYNLVSEEYIKSLEKVDY